MKELYENTRLSRVGAYTAASGENVYALTAVLTPGVPGDFGLPGEPTDSQTLVKSLPRGNIGPS
jgi:hypothetical protein